MINRNTDVVKFLKALVTISLIVIACDWLSGRAFQYLYSKQKSGVLYRTTYAIDSTTADYLVLGASRANHHYDPQVFEKSLKASFYNCGRDKQSIFYSCAVISSILNRYTPKCVIIEIRPDEFSQIEEGELASLLPYHNNKAIKPYLKYNGKFQNLKLLSHIYPFNSLLTNLIVGLDKNWSTDYKGYLKRTAVIKNDSIKVIKENTVVDSLKILEFNNTLNRLSQKNIPTLLVISPMHYKYINSITTNICSKAEKRFNNTTFLNFTNNEAWMSTRFYSDDYHLNDVGAKLFSSEISNYITGHSTN